MTLVTLGWQRLKSNWLNGRQRLTSRSLPRPLLMHSTLLRFTYMQCTAFHFKNIRHSNALHCTESSESLLQRRTLKEAQACHCQLWKVLVGLRTGWLSLSPPKIMMFQIMYSFFLAQEMENIITRLIIYFYFFFIVFDKFSVGKIIWGIEQDHFVTGA